MAVKIKHFDWFRSGAIMGLFLSIVLPMVAGIQEIGISFSIYNIRQNLGSYVDMTSAFGQYLSAFVNLSFPGMLYAALGFGALCLLARYVVDWLKFIKPKWKFPAVFVIAALLQGMIMSMQLPTFEFMVLLELAITALILSWILKALYKQMKWPLPA